METYSEFKPTAFDNHIHMNERENWLIVPVSRTRDTGALEESNFETALESLGGESDTVEVHRFGHWGPGWFEIIIVDPESKQADIAEDIERALADYPVLDDMDLSNREFEEQCESWSNWAESDFITALDKKFDTELDGAYLGDYEYSEDKLLELFNKTADSINVYWHSEGDSQCIDIERIAAAITLEQLGEVFELDDIEVPFTDPNQLTLNL